MKSIRTGMRFLLLAAITLPAVGCGGCDLSIDKAAWDAATRDLVGQIYLEQHGPWILASAVGSAAPPGGMGGLSVLSTEIAWRQLLEQVIAQDEPLTGPREAASIASVVGTAAAPSGSGGLSAVVAMVTREDWVKQFPPSWHLPSLFEVPDPHRANGVLKPADRVGEPIH